MEIKLSCFAGSGVPIQSQELLLHNKLFGSVDYMYFASKDTGYIMTNVGNLYTRDRCVYIYQTTDGGMNWNIIDYILHYCIIDNSHVILSSNLVCGFIADGSSSNKHWNLYLCIFDLKKKRHMMYNEIIYEPCDIFLTDNKLCSTVYKEDHRCLFNYDYVTNTSSFDDDSINLSIKDIAYNDSSLGILTYDNQLYYITQTDTTIYDIGAETSSVHVAGDRYYIAYREQKNDNVGIVRLESKLNKLDILQYPSGYKYFKFFKGYANNILITFAKKELNSACDMIYSNDEGLTWNTINLHNLRIMPEICSYCEPYIYIDVKTQNNPILKIHL